MNFYAFHIGDYAVHTRHLSLLEDLAYRRLLDWYYIHERAIPEETQSVCRLIGMRDHATEVGAVLVEFFTKNEAGEWTHPRCEAEIARAKAHAERARKNGKNGGRPSGKPGKADAPAPAPKLPDPGKTDSVLSGPPEKSDSKAPNPNPNPNPIGSSSPTSKKKTPPPSVGAAVLVAAGFDEAVAAEFIAHKARLKAPLTERAWADHLREATKAGWTPQAAAEKVMARSWKGFEAKYVAAEPQPGSNVVTKPAWKREQQHRSAVMTGGLLGKFNDEPETIDVPAARVG